MGSRAKEKAMKWGKAQNSSEPRSTGEDDSPRKELRRAYLLRRAVKFARLTSRGLLALFMKPAAVRKLLPGSASRVLPSLASYRTHHRAITAA